MSLTDVTGRVGTAFYAERVPKKFYDRFKKEHDAFLKFLKGIPDEEMQKWYVKVVYDEFFPRPSKPIIDKIDRVLAEHYGFTDEELDFIINYDIKYRMGLGN